MNRKKYAIILPSLGMGGAERVASEIANEMIKHNNYVQFILLDNNDVYYKLDRRIKVDFMDYDEKKNKIIKNYYRIKKLRCFLKKESIDIVISFLTSANFLAILSAIGTNTKVFVSERSNPNIDSTIIKFIRKILYRMADGCVFQTTDAMNLFKGKIRRNSIVIENPVKSNLPRWSNYKKHDDSIVTACRLEKSKNIPMLLLAFSKIIMKYDEFKLLIFGDGPEKENIYHLIEKMNLKNNVFLMGKDINWHVMAVKCRIFVLSSDYEGMSNSLLEALAMGMPVVSTDHPIGGAKALINNNENGFLVPVNDSDAMAESLFKIISNKELQNNFSKNAEKICQTLSISNITNKWLKYVNKE